MVELMVAVAIGLFLTVAVLLMQLKLTAQNVRSSDTVLRDNEARAAMDNVTRELSGGGFLNAGNNGNCYAVLTYNTNLPGASKFFASFPAQSLPGGAGITLPFIPAQAQGNVLNYPPAGSPNRSDVLMVRSTLDATVFSAASAPVLPTMDDNVSLPMTTGQLPFAANVVNGANVTVNDPGLVLVNVGTPPNSQVVCIRVPISAVGAPVAGVSKLSSSGALMPPNFYADFSGQLANIGLNGLALSNISLRSSKLIELGASSQVQPQPYGPALPNQVNFVYFVVAPDPASNNYKWPTLVRATINAFTDTEIPQSRREIATGVASFQVLFGIGTPATGVTSYQTWAQVIAAANVPNVMSVRIMVLTRTLNADKDYTDAPTKRLLSKQFSQNGYTDYTVPGAELNNRFVAQEIELPIRSASPLWPK